MENIPVYIFCGFLGAGKTKFINESLADKRFNPGEQTLLLLCEEGEEEYTPENFASPNVVIERIEDLETLTPDRLSARVKRSGAKRVLVEYNGMWSIFPFFDAMPENWDVYQLLYLCNAEDILVYNQNMRNLVAECVQNADMVVFNRVEPDADVMPYHKLVRGLSRELDIVYEYTDGSHKVDEIVDPLPFDINAPIVEIADRDYAIFYRDLMEDMQKYDGKTVRFLSIMAKNSQIPRGTVAGGRHVMTCCVQDISYHALAILSPDAEKYKSGDWAIVEGTIRIERHSIYTKKGPVVHATSITPAAEPEEKVATFY